MTHNLTAETISYTGHHGDLIEGYLAVPTSGTMFGSIVVIHHLPGYDESTKEITRRFAAAGYAALMPNLYHRIAPGADPDDAAALARVQGGIPDEQLVGDVSGAQQYLVSLPNSNAKVAAIGFCSGGRQAVLVGCRLPLQGTIDCYGAYVVIDSSADSALRATSLLSEIPQLQCPILGLFGAEDSYPSVEQTGIFEAALIEANKNFEFHTYEDAGHAFFAADRPSYRPEVVGQAWDRILSFLQRTIS
jgi:carboxymethylenebutenolidase